MEILLDNRDLNAPRLASNSFYYSFIIPPGPALRYFISLKNLKAADSIFYEIIKTAETISYPSQYQKEEFLESRHRRAIYKHFKIIYSVVNKELHVLKVFDTRQDPSKLKL